MLRWIHYQQKLTTLYNYRFLRWVVFFLLTVNTLLVSSDILFPFKFYIPYSQQVYSADSVLLRTFLSPDDKWRLYSRVEEIPPEFKQFILFKEDRFFYYHFGINPFALVRAGVQNIKSNKRISGASTITMQTVRLLEPRKRTYKAKLIEIFRSIQLELYYSKDEIFNLYLNLIPAGSNIEGAKAGAYLYFGKPPHNLSLAQCVTLAILPNRPNSLRPGRRDAALLQARNHWLKQAQKAQLFDTLLIQAALNEPPDCYRRPPPNDAPQLAIRLVKKYPHQNTIYAGVQSALQKKAQALTRNYVRRIRHTGISNAAALIIDNKTRNIIAYIGSADFENKLDDGENDGVQAVRSPGSTLKPFLFAACADAGLLTPTYTVLDAPVNFGGYSPENYDETYNGNVTAAFALANSLNIPAVKWLNQYGTLAFSKKLNAVGVPIDMRSKKLGLSLILGGCGTKLEELATLYTTMANLGKYKPLSYLKQTIGLPPRQVLSAEAVYLTAEILTQLRRPDLPFNYQYAQDLPKIAWKTGTSYGRRDAWSIGFTPTYTVAVWVGNFDGTGNPALSGAEVATPLLFELFRAISKPNHTFWYARPNGLSKRTVCSFSGLLPNAYCTDIITDNYIAGVSSNARCQHLLPIWVSDDEKIAYCGSCVPLHGTKQKIYPNLSPELSMFYDLEKIPYLSVPPHNPACTQSAMENQRVKIISPTNNAEYYIELGKKQKIALECLADNQTESVYWFVNDKFISRAQAKERVFIVPDTGTIKIVCRAGAQAKDHIQIKVHAWGKP